MKASQLILLLVFVLFKIITILLQILLKFIIHPTKLFAKRIIFRSPACLQDETFGTHEFITVNGIKLHCVVSGPVDSPVMLMLHGFPEFWYSWRYQIKEFNTDYRVVAVDLRGYGESDKPLNIDTYTIQQVTSDIIELISIVCKGKKCTLVAHDWGGIFAWRVVYQRPDLIDKYIVMCCPHAKRYIELASQDNTTLFRQWYVFLFQIPVLPVLIMKLDNYSWLWGVFKSRKSGLTNSERMSEEDLLAFLYTFSQENALKCPLYYYRQMFSKNPTPREAKPHGNNKITVPTLLMMGVHDAFLTLGLGEGHEKYVENIRVKNINGSHWIQQDCPEEVNREMRDFLVD